MIPIKNSDYWKQRFEQLEAAQNQIGVDAFKEIERQYREAQKQIEGQIARWYQRFADNNGITLAQARQWLKSADLKELKWDVQEYIKYGQENALTGSWMKELENASAKYHISKLEALKIQTQQSLEVMFSKQFGTINRTMGKLFESGYYHTAYELQKGFNIGWDIAGLDQSQIEKVLVKPWAADGKNFSERIWENKQKLISEVHKELTQNIMLGKDPQKAIDSLAKKMGTSKYNAGRLVMTEEAYFSSLAQKDCFDELGVEQYEVVATLDSHTSDICRSLDGKIFPMKDFQAGVTAPPFHVFCRSTTVPHFDEDFGEIGERAARDEKTGKTYYIPDDMNYQQWKETFVDGGDKSILTPSLYNAMIPLTSQEEWALNEYISSGSYIINESLRAGFPLTEEQRDFVKYLDTALKKMPVYKGNVYRSMDSSSMNMDIQQFWMKHAVGSIIKYPAYTSSSTVIYDETMDIQMIIESKSAYDVRNYNPKEFEILFPRNCLFIVIKREGNKIWLKEY